jgi:recombination protein RecR
MNYPSKSLEKVVLAISSLPGIGKKTALRLALHLINDKFKKSDLIASSLIDLRDNIKICQKCNMIADDYQCEICKSHFRNKSQVCVVETLRDLMAIEDTQQYNGVYHILGGVISPLNGVGPDDLNLESLVNRVKNEEITELIMAISPTIDGETTIFYISKILEGQVKISTIARGVSFGGELEYADELTLGRSIQTRVPYSIKS